MKQYARFDIKKEYENHTTNFIFSFEVINIKNG